MEKEIISRYMVNKWHNDTKCDLCGKLFGMPFRLMRHIGATHNKLLEILKEKGIEIPKFFTDPKKETLKESNEKNQRKKRHQEVVMILDNILTETIQQHEDSYFMVCVICKNNFLKKNIFKHMNKCYTLHQCSWLKVSFQLGNPFKTFVCFICVLPNPSWSNTKISLPPLPCIPLELEQFNLIASAQTIPNGTEPIRVIEWQNTCYLSIVIK